MDTETDRSVFIQPVIECRRVTVRFGDTIAVDDVSLTVDQGEVVVWLGTSGSGRSTLLRCLNRLERPDEGDIAIFGRPLSDDADSLQELRARVGIVFQEINLFPMLTVEDNVMLGPRMASGRSRRSSTRAAQRLLDRVGMRGHAGRHPGQLSSGEQQRVAVARTLAMQPEIILLDEPTAAVDPEFRRDVMQMVHEISTSGATVVAVTQDLGFITETADRVMVFDKGRIVERGPAGQVLGAPRHDVTARLLEDAKRYG